MINNPMINNPYQISVKGKLQKEDMGSSGWITTDRSTGEVQYCIPFNIQSIGSRNNFLYKILLTYVKTIFNEDEMFLDLKIVEDNMITMAITIFENPSGINRYVLAAAYVNHPVPQLEIDVLLDDEEKELIDGYVAVMKEHNNGNVVSHAYSSSAFLDKPKEVFDKILQNEFEHLT